MTKLIGIKELQMKTKQIRKDIEKGIRYIVVYRSKPIFEIRPLESGDTFADELAATNLYNADFLKRLKEAEMNLKKGKTKTHTTEEFLKSLK